MPRAETAAPPSPTEGPPWHLPRPVIRYVNLVLESADRQGRTVTVVDVDRPEGRQDLVERWVGPADVMPILVRPDGARLSGIEQFTAPKVRKFLRG